jgi:isocitrate dehydrogenase
VGYGQKSANVTLRKLFDTYGNIRPVRELPGVTTPYSGRGIDLVVVRENVEDLYAGIEYMQTPDVAQCLKRTFERIAPEYPDIRSSHIIIDNCAHQLVKEPEQFDVIVTTNMNGDIISDLTSALVGGLGFAPSANLGNGIAIFEAVHGSAPKYVGKNVINPTAALLSGVLMLKYLGEFEAASAIEHAVLSTLLDGKLTGDVVGCDKVVSTSEYARHIISNLGRRAEGWTVRAARPIKMPAVTRD